MRAFLVLIRGGIAVIFDAEAEDDGEEEERWGGRGGGRLVTRAKKARSGFRGGQGRVLRRPMPRWGVVATMRVRGGRGRGGGIRVVVMGEKVEGVGVVIVWCGVGRRVL